MTMKRRLSTSRLELNGGVSAGVLGMARALIGVLYAAR